MNHEILAQAVLLSIPQSIPELQAMGEFFFSLTFDALVVYGVSRFVMSGVRAWRHLHAGARS